MVAPLQSTGVNSGSVNPSVAYGSNLSAGTKLMAFANNSNGNVTACNDVTGTHAFSELVTVTATDGTNFTLWVMDTLASQVGTKPTITATCSAPANGTSMVIAEVPGLAPGLTAATCLDGTAGTGSGAPSSNFTPSFGAYTSHAAGLFLIAAYGDGGDSGATITGPGSPYTAFAGNQNGNSSDNTLIFYKNSTNGSETQGTWSVTCTATDGYGTILVAFKLAPFVPQNQSRRSYAVAGWQAPRRRQNADMPVPARSPITNTIVLPARELRYPAVLLRRRPASFPVRENYPEIQYNTGTNADLVGAAHTTAFTFTIPSSVKTNDAMLISLSVFTFTPTTFSISNASSGGGLWTPLLPGLVFGVQGGGLSSGAIAYVRTATSADPGSTFTVSWTGSTPPTDEIWWTATFVSYSYASIQLPIDVQKNANNEVGETTIGSCPTVATRFGNDWAVYLGSAAVASSGTMTNPTGATQRQELNNAGICSGISDSNGQVGPPGTSIGGVTFTASGAASWSVWTVGLTQINTPVPLPEPQNTTPLTYRRIVIPERAVQRARQNADMVVPPQAAVVAAPFIWDAPRFPQHIVAFMLHRERGQVPTGWPVPVQPPERMQFVRRWSRPLWPRRGVVPPTGWPVPVQPPYELPAVRQRFTRVLLFRRGATITGLPVPVQPPETSEWMRPRFTRVLLFRRGNVALTGWPVPVQPPEIPSAQRGKSPRRRFLRSGVIAPTVQPEVTQIPSAQRQAQPRKRFLRYAGVVAPTGWPVPVQPHERMQSVRRWSRPLWPRRGVVRTPVPPPVTVNPPISWSERRWSRPPWPRRGVIAPTGWPVPVQPPERMQAVHRWSRPPWFRRGTVESVVPPPPIPPATFVPITQRTRRIIRLRSGRTTEPVTTLEFVQSVQRISERPRLRRGSSVQAPEPITGLVPPVQRQSRYRKISGPRRVAPGSIIPLPQYPLNPTADRRKRRFTPPRKGVAQPGTGLPVSVQPPERMQYVRRWIRVLLPRRIIPPTSLPTPPAKVRLPVWLWITIFIPEAEITQYLPFCQVSIFIPDVQIVLFLPAVNITVFIPLENEEEV